MKILFRNFIRFRSSFLINLVSLSTGMASAFMIYLWVNDELSMDKFHRHESRLFQVMQNMPSANGIHTTDATPGLLADALQREMPGVEMAVIEYPGRGSKGIIRNEEKSFNAVEQYVTENYFEVFSYRVLHGSAIKYQQDVMISGELAIKLFGSDDVVGKTIEWDQGNLTELKGTYNVSGVFEKPGANSSNQFDVVFSYELLRNKYGDMLGLNSWEGSDPHTYVLLREGIVPEDLSLRENFFLLKYSHRYLSGGRIFYVRLFSSIAILILLLACINFMNLATARVTGRLKEIGVKKTMGADRAMIAWQFIKESVAMAFLTLPVAIVIVVIFLPSFNEITGKQLILQFDPTLITSMIVVALTTGLISGSYPALYLSRFSPAEVLKGKFSNSQRGTTWLRSVLVIFQFSISIILVVFVSVVYNQMQHVHAKNLGYEKDNVIHFVSKGRILENGSETFLNEVKQIPGVVDASSYQSSIVTKDKRGTLRKIEWDGKDPEYNLSFSYLRMGIGAIETLDMKVIEGRPFSEQNDSNIILNETAVSLMGMKDPVGQTITIEGAEKKIIGVVKDFHFESFYEPIKPCILMTTRRPGDRLMVRIEAASEKETLARIETFYRSYNDGLAFEYDFLDEDYKAVYAAEQRVASLSQYFAGIAIVISCLGLLGLTAFTVERKVKEIGIRKILGSSVVGIVFLLSKKFLSKIVIALMISLPLSYYLTSNWLSDFAFRINLHVGYFAVTAGLTLVVSFVTMCFYIIKVAYANPVQSLKQE